MAVRKRGVTEVNSVNPLTIGCCLRSGVDCERVSTAGKCEQDLLDNVYVYHIQYFIEVS